MDKLAFTEGSGKKIEVTLEPGNDTLKDLDKTIEELPNISPTEMLILLILLNNESMYGLDIARESNGRIKRGSIYVLLQRLEFKGIVTSHIEVSPKRHGPPVRRYEIDALHKPMIRAWLLCQKLLAKLAKDIE